MNMIEFGDCRDTMRRWAEQGIKAQMCVTSPPYYGLRDYGVDGQLGLEQTPDEYVQNMVEVFRCVRDVLADDGTLWLNIGDSYYNYRPGKGQALVKQSVSSTKQDLPDVCPRRGKKLEGLKEKDLIGIPWMLAFALRADGWYLRQDIIWHKPSPMPESVRDRCTKAHEYIFLLSKRPRYYFDAEAMKEPAIQAGRVRADSFAGRQGTAEYQVASGGIGSVFTGAQTRNRRSVWTVATKPYNGAHFATFPPALIEPCILAGTSERGHCPVCGARWVRVTEKGAPVQQHWAPGTQKKINSEGAQGKHGKTSVLNTGFVTPRITTGWLPACTCGADPVPDIVLDPFMGSGTTAAVAVHHGRQYLGCELNPEYKALQDERIQLSREDAQMLRHPDLFEEVSV